MADEAAVVEEGAAPAENPLVAVTFQKNLQRAQKYLESEPKALGITQICFSLFHIILIIMLIAQELASLESGILFLIASPLVMIAGCVAIVAQNLNLTMLRACLGMQIVSCGASVLNLFGTLAQMSEAKSICWHYYYENRTMLYADACLNMEHTHSHIAAEIGIVHAALFAISATLAAYSCKVVNCCSAAPRMTVITVQAPAVQQ
ncbi:hypothetical protein JOB18_050026 [Solea senegalensis]|uniref:Uncharacterized protein n=1 Tax=Solea senegalensis TaxID=28829 RepID=A0AAV6QZR3_SOLSE|nr:uncharacterized protein LOC122767139 isoform X1 [Solea senegalensis]KAG7498145.1 hypothetical protein JOB18_050026 [Solea senegalensis]